MRKVNFKSKNKNCYSITEKSFDSVNNLINDSGSDSNYFEENQKMFEKNNHFKFSQSSYYLHSNRTEPECFQHYSSKNNWFDNQLKGIGNNYLNLTNGLNKSLRSRSSSPPSIFKCKFSVTHCQNLNREPPLVMNKNFKSLNQKITTFNSNCNQPSLVNNQNLNQAFNSQTMDFLKENLNLSFNKFKSNCVKRRQSDVCFDRISNAKQESYHNLNPTARSLIRSNSSVFTRKVQSFRSRSGPSSPIHDVNKKIEQKDAYFLKTKTQLFHLPAMDLIQIGSRKLWCEVPQVKELGLLRELSPLQRQLQEAMFEVITSEASYLKSLDILVNHFFYNILFFDPLYLNQVKREELFSNILEVRSVSYKLMNILELRWKQNVILSDIADVLLNFLTYQFSPFITYCRYKKRQEKALKDLQLSSKFNEILKQVESQPICQGLTFHSYLLLPMQRVTRYPLLIEAILKRLSPKSIRFLTCKKALVMANRLVNDCNQAANQYDKYLDLITKLKFGNVKSFLLNQPRWQISSFEVTRIKSDYQPNILISSFRVPHWHKSQTVVSVLSDLLILSKKKGDDLIVYDYCYRELVQLKKLKGDKTDCFVFSHKLSETFKNAIKVIFLHNYNGKKVEYCFNFSSQDEMLKFIEVIEFKSHFIATNQICEKTFSSQDVLADKSTPCLAKEQVNSSSGRPYCLAECTQEIFI